METKKIVEKLNNFCESFFSKNVVEMDISLFKEAAERLEELEAEKENLVHYNADLNNRLNKAESHIEKLEKQLSEKQPEWISVKDGKEMPDAFSFTGICHNQFPRLVVAIDENSHVTHWMMLDAPKPKEPTFRDVFLKAFPKTCNVCFTDFCPKTFFESIKCPLPVVCSEKTVEACWNQPYFETEGEGEQE